MSVVSWIVIGKFDTDRYVRHFISVLSRMKKIHVWSLETKKKIF